MSEGNSNTARIFSKIHLRCQLASYVCGILVTARSQKLALLVSFIFFSLFAVQGGCWAVYASNLEAIHGWLCKLLCVTCKSELWPPPSIIWGMVCLTCYHSIAWGILSISTRLNMYMFDIIMVCNLDLKCCDKIRFCVWHQVDIAEGRCTISSNMNSHAVWCR